MNSNRLPLDIAITALAPIIWGSTYLVTSELLPAGYPLTMALLRALPAGLLLLLIVRRLPRGVWIYRTAVLGALNFSLFWSLLFVAAYRLPGGVAATVGAIQPLLVVALARLWLGQALLPLAIVSGMLGIGGVGMLVLAPQAELDGLGILAALIGAAAMAAGTVLSRRWHPPVSNLTFTAWQLSAGGLFLVPLAFCVEPPLPALELRNLGAIAYLSLIGAALSYFCWFRGIARLEPAAVASLGLLSPLVAVLLGWLVLQQTLTAVQLAGIFIVLLSIWFSQNTHASFRGGKALLPER